MTFETFSDAAEQLPRFIDDMYNRRRLHSALGYLSRKRGLKAALRLPA